MRIKPPAETNNFIRFAAIFGLLACAWADEPSKPSKGEWPRLLQHQVAEPINPSYKNPFTRIRNMILPETEYVFAILGTGHAGFAYFAVVVTEDGDGYRCEWRTLDIKAAIEPDGRMSVTKLGSLKVLSKSKQIAPEIIGVLKAELEPQVALASYLPRRTPQIPCDGWTNEVYCGHDAAEIWPAPGPFLTAPDSIFTALRQLVASDNPGDHLRWNQIRAYLDARKAGRKPSPFVPQPPPVRIEDSDLPPL